MGTKVFNVYNVDAQREATNHEIASLLYVRSVDALIEQLRQGDEAQKIQAEFVQSWRNSFRCKVPNLKRNVAIVVQTKGGEDF